MIDATHNTASSNDNTPFMAAYTALIRSSWGSTGTFQLISNILLPSNSWVTFHNGHHEVRKKHPRFLARH